MPYQHILVAVDLTEECDPVVTRAQKLAKASGAKMSLVHIVEPMAMAFGGDVPMDLSMLQQQQFEQARERLDICGGIAGRHLLRGLPDALSLLGADGLFLRISGVVQAAQGVACLWVSLSAGAHCADRRTRPWHRVSERPSGSTEGIASVAA